MTPAVPKLLFTVKEAAYSLACCPATVRQYIKTGMLRASRKGHTILIHHKDLELLANHIREFGPPSVWGNKPWPTERAEKHAQPIS